MKLLTKTLKRQVIERENGEVYLIRRALNTPWGGVKLHHMLHSDDDRDCHDHPWSFVSIILKGGYWEHRPDVREGWCWTSEQDEEIRAVCGLVDPGVGCVHCDRGCYRHVDARGAYHTSAGGMGADWRGPFRRVLCSARVERTVRTWYGPGSVLYRPAPSPHRIELPEGKTSWSLVFTAPKSRPWGFYTICGWVDQRYYWNAKRNGC